MIKKLCDYCIDCVKSAGRISGFNNLKSDKNNRIIITDATEFEADNKEVVEMMTLYALNRSTMNILRGCLFVEGVKGHNRYYSPLLYTEAELIREDDKIRLLYDEDNVTINIGLISSLLDSDIDIVENTINQLLDIENPEKIDFKKVINGLINLEGLTIKDETAVILARLPESTAGLLNELKIISNEY